MIYAARKDSPLIIGQNEKGTFIASDVPAILSYTRSVYYIDNLEMAQLTAQGVTFYNIDRRTLRRKKRRSAGMPRRAEKGGYEHFMMKEIHEQPKAVQDTINTYVKDGKIDLDATGLTDEFLKELTRIYFVACGSAYHVGLAAKYIIEDLTDIPVEVDLASEYRYRKPQAGGSFSGGDYFPVRRDGRQPGCPASDKRTGSSHPGNYQCVGSSIAEGSGLCDVHPGRTGNCGGHHQGLQHPADQLLSAGYCDGCGKR